MQMALFLGNLYRSFSLFPSSHLVLPFLSLCGIAPSYIKQTVSLAALGDIALIFQLSVTGVMQCATMDTLHENLSLLKWAKCGRASLSDTDIYLRVSFLLSVLYYMSWNKNSFFPSVFLICDISRGIQRGGRGVSWALPEIWQVLHNYPELWLARSEVGIMIRWSCTVSLHICDIYFTDFISFHPARYPL